jgi:sugar transferase (PEP-CTERM system associated)
LSLLAKGGFVRNKIILLAGDVLVGITALIPVFRLNSLSLPMWTLWFIPVVLLFSYLCEVYQPEKWTYKERMVRSLLALVFSFVLLVLLPGKPTTQAWTAGLPGLAISLVLFFTLQHGWQSLFHKSNDAHFFAEKIIVIGTGTTAKNVETLIDQSPGKYALLGYVETPMDPISVEPEKIIGHIDNIVELAQKHNARAIVIALTERRGNLVASKLVTCKLMGVRIIDYPSFFELITGKIPVEHINPSWLVQSQGFLITPFIRSLKKVVDLILSSLLLCICLPFFPVITLLIKLDSPGPVLYSQQRVGLNGKLFTIYKFRSMANNSEKETGASWAQENDPRATLFGAFMRKTRIDELPQLINVFKGDMSFIGPRPERPEFVEQISSVTPYYPERHALKPGITGWAQVMYPYGASLGDSVEKLRYDLYYINNLSLFLDLIIVFETIKIVLFRRGSR